MKVFSTLMGLGIFVLGSASAATCQAGLSTLQLTVDGQARTALLYRPQSVAAQSASGQTAPAVLTLHGSQSNAQEQLKLTDLQRLADKGGFVVVAPQGILPAGSGFAWNVPGVTTTPFAYSDEHYLSQLADQLAAQECVDPQRIYGTGYSGGGRMLSQYMCDVPDKLAAIAIISGLRVGTPRKAGDGHFEPDAATCQPKRPVSILAFQGNSDKVNPYPGGGLPYWQYSAAQAIAGWQKLDGCAPHPVITRFSEHVWHSQYGPCKDSADLQYYVINGGGHTWPGSPVPAPALGSTTQEISASETAWNFFKDKTLTPNH